MKEKDTQLFKIKNTIIEHTDECFDVSFDSDSGGNHFTLYLVDGSIDTKKLRQEISDRGIRRRIVIVLSDEKFIKSRHDLKYGD